MLTKKKKANHSAKGSGGDFGPAIPYRLDLSLTDAERTALFKEPALVVMMRLDKPVERNGKKFSWFVHPVRLTPEGNPVNLGRQILCHDEAEANAERERLLSVFKKEEADRKREEAERPIPCEVLNSVEVIRGRALRIDAIPISLLPHATGAEIPANELPADEPFIDIGQAYWQGTDGSGQAALSVVRETHEFIKVFRLVRYAQPVEVNGKLFPFGVEFAECDLQLKALRVIERCFCATEREADESFKRKQAATPKLRAQLLQQQPKSPQEQQEEVRIRQLQAFADKAHNPAAKAPHLKVIEGIRAEQRERQRVKAEVGAEKARLAKEQHAAFARLIHEYFPTVQEVKARMKGDAEKQMPKWREELRRAMRVDCARLGIQSPFHQLVMDDAFTLEVSKALNAKSPVKPDQIEAVLNWMAKGYAVMPEQEWTAKVSKQIKVPVNPAGLGKTISKKFGLKSKLKGRPETESGKNGAA